MTSNHSLTALSVAIAFVLLFILVSLAFGIVVASSDSSPVEENLDKWPRYGPLTLEESPKATVGVVRY